MDRLYCTNLEGYEEWNIPERFWENRPQGLSAFIRAKNESDFLEYSVKSILDWHDEVLIILQGGMEDHTLEVALELEAAHSKVRVILYPFESWVNGPGHINQPRGSVHERAYFYNWCMAQTKFSHVDKWDGDMIAHEGLGDIVRAGMNRYEGIYFFGKDLAGRDLRWESRKAHTANEQRVYRLTEKTFYFTYTHCEHLAATALDEFKNQNVLKIPGPQYTHLKWCKSSLEYSGVGWPADWMTADPYYREIATNKAAARPYSGPYPKAIRPYLQRVTDETRRSRRQR